MKVKRVSAAVIRRGDEILATLRSHGEYRGYWEFPGGKLEEGETPQQAAVREVREELSADVALGELISQIEYDYPAVKILSAAALQIPLIGTVALFSVIFGMYAAQDLGNLPLTSAAGSFGDGLSIVTERQYSEERKVLPVYEIAVASREETRSQAEAFFRNTGTELDESRTDLYDDAAVYYDRNGNSLWIDYAGSVYSYTDFDAAFDESAEKKTNASEAEIVSALEGLGVSLPEGGVFAGGEEGRYRIDYRRNVLDDVMYDGSVNCTYLKDGRISELRYHVFACEIYKEYQVISEQAAYQRIVSGAFGGSAEGDSEICLGDVSITYMIDSKGFYQPVYRFEIQGTGSSDDVPNREGQILVPALENK